MKPWYDLSVARLWDMRNRFSRKLSQLLKIEAIDFRINSTLNRHPIAPNICYQVITHFAKTAMSLSYPPKECIYPSDLVYHIGLVDGNHIDLTIELVMANGSICNKFPLYPLKVESLRLNSTYIDGRIKKCWKSCFCKNCKPRFVNFLTSESKKFHAASFSYGYSIELRLTPKISLFPNRDGLVITSSKSAMDI